MSLQAHADVTDYSLKMDIFLEDYRSRLQRVSDTILRLTALQAFPKALRGFVARKFLSLRVAVRF